MRTAKYLLLTTLLISTWANAELQGSVAVTSDFDIRGISQTDEQPALQLAGAWTDDSGLYARATASNVDMRAEADYRFDVYSGFRGATAAGLGWDIGAGYYLFQPTDDDFDFGEIYAGLSYRAFAARIWYSPRFAGTADDAYYVEGNVALELPSEFSLLLHAGHSFGDAITRGIGEYSDFAVGVARRYEAFEAALRYVATDIEDSSAGDSRLIVSVSMSLPRQRDTRAARSAESSARIAN